MKTDSIKRALELRKNLRLDDKILVVDFSDTLQGADTSRVIDLMPNIKTGKYVFRAKVNVKELDIVASGVYGKEYFDVNKHSDKEIEDFVKKQDFDFPLWFKHDKGFEMKKVNDYNFPFIMQVAGCNFHDGSSTGGCWYCFVDDKSNDGKIGEGKAFLTIDETIDSMISEETKNNRIGARKYIKEWYKKKGQEVDIKVLRVSGGEPTIVLDWVLNLWRKIGERNLDIVGQLDSNLSTGYLVDEFEKEGIYENNILEKLAEFPVKVLTALKGCDEENLQTNVQSNATMQAQEYSLKKFIKAGFDIYPQMYNPNPDTLKDYLIKMDNLIENFSLRVHIGPLKIYGPTSLRLGLEAEKSRIEKYAFIEKHRKKWDDNYKKSVEVMENYLRERYDVGYKEITRSDAVLRIK